MALVSVVIPVYNVKDYLERCFQSVINQSIADLEIILVDDGSTDGSGELCDLLKSRDSRVQVIHQENQGLGPARNSGLTVATGEYVSFIDSDDWIEQNTYEILINSMERNQCRIAACGRKIVDDDKCLDLVYCNKDEKVLNGEDIIEHYLLQNDMNMSACDKLFERSLFEDIQFPSGYVSEDVVPIYEVLKRVDKIALTGKPLYNYYCRPGSLSRSHHFARKGMGLWMYCAQVAADVKTNFPMLSEQANYYEYDALISTWRKILRANHRGEERKQVWNRIKQVYFKMVSNQYMHKKQRIYALLMILRVERLVEKLVR
jgi:glycosyltransferase involved in cell wall biosynthesis